MHYRLQSIIVHLGDGATRGHYIAVVRGQDKWWVYDDQIVEEVDENYLACLFGSGYTQAGDQRTGYGFMHGAPESDL